MLLGKIAPSDVVGGVAAGLERFLWIFQDFPVRDFPDEKWKSYPVSKSAGSYVLSTSMRSLTWSDWVESFRSDIGEFEDIVAEYKETISQVPEVKEVVRANNIRKVSFVALVSDDMDGLYDKVYPIQERLERKYPHWAFDFHYIEPSDSD